MAQDEYAFRVTAQGAAGLTPAQVRHPRYVKTSRGVRLAADVPVTAPAREAAALIGAPAAALLCDVSAARRWGAPLPPWIGLQMDSGQVAVAVPRGDGRQRRAGVRGRRLTVPPEHLVLNDGHLVTTPARTFLDCAELIPLEHLVAMGDALLRQRLAELAELEQMVRWGKGRRGVATARRALQLLDPRAESPSESLVRCHLVLAGIPRPVCNLDIIVDGEWLARADLAWLEQRLIGEYDGAVHLSERSRRADAARRNLLQDAGWQVIVFTARDLAHPWEMANLVRSALRSRTPR